MCVGIVAACKNVQHVSAWCLWGPEESIRSPRPRVVVRSHPPCATMWALGTRVLWKNCWTTSSDPLLFRLISALEMRKALLCCYPSRIGFLLFSVPPASACPIAETLGEYHPKAHCCFLAFFTLGA